MEETTKLRSSDESYQQQLDEEEEVLAFDQLRKELMDLGAHKSMAAEAFVVFHYFQPKEMRVTLDLDYELPQFGYTEISGRDLDQIKETVKSLTEQNDQDVAEKYLKHEIYNAAAYNMAQHIQSTQEYPQDNSYLNDKNCVASPLFEFSEVPYFSFACELFDLLNFKVNKDDYFRKEMSNLKEFLEVNWNVVDYLSKELIDSLEMTDEEIRSVLDACDIE